MFVKGLRKVRMISVGDKMFIKGFPYSLRSYTVEAFTFNRQNKMDEKSMELRL